MKRITIIASCVSAMIAGCGGGDDGPSSPDATADLTAVSRVTPDAPTSVCPSGGFQVDTGLDQNGNGQLDEFEITNTTHVCNESSSSNTPNILLDSRIEPPGANCAAGGTAILLGVDEDNDGNLSPPEVTTTRFVCNPTQPGSSALVITTAAPAARCPHGGVRFEVGIDTNGNGTLEPSEITNTSYACHGRPGQNSLLDVKPEPPGANCTSGGSVITVGLDRDGNGILSDHEVTGTRYICHGVSDSDTTPPKISVTAPEVASSNWQEYSVSISDDVQLAYVRFPSANGYDMEYLDEGIKTYDFEHGVRIPLGEKVTRVVQAADTSGNISKQEITISSPPVGMKLGKYTPDGSVTLPSGFDCHVPFPGASDDGKAVKDLLILSSEKWSTEQGYWPRMQINIANGPGLSAGGGEDSYYGHPLATVPDPHPISATSLYLDGGFDNSGGGSGESYFIMHKAKIDPVIDNPDKVSITITQSCSINEGAFVDGTPLTFEASFSQPYP